MIPVIVRTTEEMLRIVPNDLREASYALGVPKWKTILRIVLPTALAGHHHRASCWRWPAWPARPHRCCSPRSCRRASNWNPFTGPQASLPLFVWDNISSGTNPSIDRAWGGALVLILLVMLFYIGAKLVAMRFAPKAR